LSDILLPHQVKRLDELNHQLRLRGGVMALFAGDLLRDLRVTDAQREELRKRAEEIERQTQQKIAEIRRQATEDVVKALTAEQQTKFRELVGETFEFQNEVFAPGPPPGQGGPPQPPRREN
jgi:hypothetical protein